METGVNSSLTFTQLSDAVVNFSVSSAVIMMSSDSLSLIYNQFFNIALFFNNFFIAFFQGSYIYSMGMRSNVLCYQQACKTCHKYKHCLRKHSQTRLREVETTVKRSTSRTIPVESFMNWTVLGNYLFPCTVFTV